MKKILLLMLLVLCLTSCTKEKMESVDYSKYNFTDVTWNRNANEDVETIRFSSDGQFSYSCSCGNPVNDADLCENYTYDDNDKTISLKCFEITDSVVENIKIVSVSDDKLELDFDGEIRTFNKMQEED